MFHQCIVLNNRKNTTTRELAKMWRHRLHALCVKWKKLRRKKIKHWTFCWNKKIDASSCNFFFLFNWNQLFKRWMCHCMHMEWEKKQWQCDSCRINRRNTLKLKFELKKWIERKKNANKQATNMSSGYILVEIYNKNGRKKREQRTFVALQLRWSQKQ